MRPLHDGLRSGHLARCVRTPFITTRRDASTRSKLFTIAEEVRDALATGRPVVALETTIYTHGYPYPENVALASRLESLVRVNGGVPATIGIVEGKAHVGMEPDTLIKLISTAGSKDTRKVSRRDLGFIGGLGLRGTKLNGGTTIASTMILAHLAGIKIFATGGLGGVHRNGENSMDISADLTELGRTPVAVIASGCKSFLDIPRTLEYLETQGVSIGTFADGRTGDVDFPAFFSRDSGVRSPQTIESEFDAAAIVHAQFQLPVHSGLLFANPVPDDAAMARSDIDTIIAQAVTEADEKGISGSANTPYILKRIREMSDGRSVVANRALIEANVVRGTKIAVELAKLEFHERNADMLGSTSEATIQVPALTNTYQSQAPAKSSSETLSPAANIPCHVDLLVIGSLACDTICDYTPFDASGTQTSPILRTSNPAEIGQSTGGVGHNVATAAFYTGAKVALASVVADDIAGNSLIDQVRKSGLDPSYIRQLSTTSGARTAQYVAVNDVNKDLMTAMADMGIFTRTELENMAYWRSILDAAMPKWLVVDANWSIPVLSAILKCSSDLKIPVAFEPVSTAKAARLFHKTNTAITSTMLVPDHIVNIATPNALELRAMHNSAQESGLFETDQWWLTVNSFGLSSAGSRDKFTMVTNPQLVDEGVPQQIIRLLPYIPNIITKLGSQGVLMTSLLRRDDERLRDPHAAPHILARNDSGSGPIGGVYMRLFPAAEVVNQEDIMSVNGVGDTLLGVLMAGLINDTSQVARLEELVPMAQKAAVLTLKSREAVSPLLRGLQ